MVLIELQGFWQKRHASWQSNLSNSAYRVRFQVKNEANPDTDCVMLYELVNYLIDYYVPKASGKGCDTVHTNVRSLVTAYAATVFEEQAKPELQITIDHWK